MAFLTIERLGAVDPQQLLASQREGSWRQTAFDNAYEQTQSEGGEERRIGREDAPDLFGDPMIRNGLAVAGGLAVGALLAWLLAGRRR